MLDLWLNWYNIKSIDKKCLRIFIKIKENIRIWIRLDKTLLFMLLRPIDFLIGNPTSKEK